MPNIQDDCLKQLIQGPPKLAFYSAVGRSQQMIQASDRYIKCLASV